MDAKPKKGAWFGMVVSQHGPEAFGSAMVKVLTILTVRTWPVELRGFTVTDGGSRTSQRGRERPQVDLRRFMSNPG